MTDTPAADRKSVPLKYPKTVNGVQITGLSMRRSTVLDRRIASKVSTDPVDQEIRLFANLCDVPEDVINALDEVDYDQLQDTYLGFKKPAG